MAFLPLLAPLLFVATAAYLALRGLNGHLRLPEAASLGACGVALSTAGMLALHGPTTSPLIGVSGIGLSVRTDIVSVVMLCLVAFIGWVVMRFSVTYTDGEERQAQFLIHMLLALAAVMALVTAGNLIQLVMAWVCVGLLLLRLIAFYDTRKAALRAARKKLWSSVIGWAALVGAVLLMARDHGTTDIATILAQAGSGTALTTWAAALLAIAAVVKSAQAPFHGWLTEVMEAPTPVSALLHAGVVNAGGFLLIRFADVMLQTPGVLAALVMIGGFSALLGGVVMLAQPLVKTSLAWSTLAQMGFMIFQCGLALFPLALLHIVAHSLYKAHAFLSSGTAVAAVASIRKPGLVAVPNGRAVLSAFAIAVMTYAAISLAIAPIGKSPQAIALGAILVFGAAYLLAQGLADAAPRALGLRMAAAAAIVTVSYVALQAGADWLTSGTLPAAPVPGPLEWALVALALFSFGLVALAQSTFPLWAGHPAVADLRVHLANGLYFNAIFDRLTGGWRMQRTQKEGQ